MLKSPKARFIQDRAAAERFINMVNTPEFIYAMDMAMLELIENLIPTTPTEYGLTAAQISGAKAYRNILTNLGTIHTFAPSTPSMPSTLN